MKVLCILDGLECDFNFSQNRDFALYPGWIGVHVFLVSFGVIVCFTVLLCRSSVAVAISQ